MNLQGLDNGKEVDSLQLIDVISRGLNPYTQFDEYLKLAENPEMRFVISNTTEAGIAFDPSCKLEDKPAKSYPGKLTQLLYHRFKTFNGAADKGFHIMGLQLLEREKIAFSGQVDFQPDFKGKDYLLERQLKPEARKEIIEAFAAKNIVPTSMIDISDGLSSDILHICTQSKKGCRIYEDRLPIDYQTAVMAEELNMEIAKFRAARFLWSNIVFAYGEKCPRTCSNNQPDGLERCGGKMRIHDNREREFSGLNSAIDELNPQKATIVTFNQIDSYIYKGKTVNVVPFYKLYS